MLSIVSLRRVRSSIAASQFCIRISEASFPHREFRAFLSVAGTCTNNTEYTQTQGTRQLNRKHADFICSRWSVIALQGHHSG